MKVLCENDVFSISVVSTKKQYSSFLKKVSVFPKICFKVTVLKTFKTSSYYPTKSCRSFKQRATLKTTSTVFYRNLCSFCMLFIGTYALFIGTYALFIGTYALKWNLYEKALLRQKTTQILPLKLLKGATIHFLSIWWITFLKHLECFSM